MNKQRKIVSVLIFGAISAINFIVSANISYFFKIASVDTVVLGLMLLILIDTDRMV